MKVTDKSVIFETISNSSCVADGLTTFIGQCRVAVDVVSYHNHSDNSALYEVQVYKRKAEFDGHAFFNITDMTEGNLFEMFELESEEYYTEHSEALARIFFLMQEHSHLADC